MSNATIFQFKLLHISDLHDSNICQMESESCFHMYVLDCGAHDAGNSLAWQLRLITKYSLQVGQIFVLPVSNIFWRQKKCWRRRDLLRELWLMQSSRLLVGAGFWRYAPSYGFLAGNGCV